MGTRPQRAACLVASPLMIAAGGAAWAVVTQQLKAQRIEVPRPGFRVAADHQAILRRGAVEGGRQIRDRPRHAEMPCDLARGALLEIPPAHRSCPVPC